MSWAAVLWPLLAAAASNTLSSLLVYWLADKSEDFLIGKLVRVRTADLHAAGVFFAPHPILVIDWRR
jgi:membrane protein YqaA with SNARE-associated domain